MIKSRPSHDDPRLTPARDDLAAEHLRASVSAARFVTGTSAEVAVAIAPLHKLPDYGAPRETELLYGEPLTIYEDKDGWSWVQSDIDNYVGYTPSPSLRAPTASPTHRVNVLRTYIFSAPDIKSPPRHLISLNSRICVTATHERFSKAGDDGYIISDHLCKSDNIASDYTRIAEKFQGTPYLWGGRSSLGLDCSALVQNALACAGIPSPRDTDMQEKILGRKIIGEHAGRDLTQTPLLRGDLIFWRGHVGIMTDGEHMIHANATWMQVTINNLNKFAARVRKQSGPPTCVRRLQS